MQSGRVVRWMASLGEIEVHSYQHRARDPRHPTQMVFDLDPGPGCSILHCARVALSIKRSLDYRGLPSFVKTSGSKGLHVMVPTRKVPYAQTSAFAHALADRFAQRHPTKIVAVLPRRLRINKVFIDWTANGPRRTIAAPWSWRHTAGQPLVSMPLSWFEVKDAVAMGDPRFLQFSPGRAVRRAQIMGDAWMHFASAAISRLPAF